MTAFGRILRLSLGDGVAKVINFILFIYVARILGVEAYGTLEFALALIAYLQLAADAGLELWGMRAVAQGERPAAIAGMVMVSRVTLTLVGSGILLALRPAFPEFTGLWVLVALLAGRVLIQAVDLRWIFMGRQEMGIISIGLLGAQLVVAAVVVSTVHHPEDVWWVPVAQGAGAAVLAGWLFIRWRHGERHPIRWRVGWPSVRHALGPALTMGTSRALALLSFNFDSVALGFLASATAVGLYNAAYRPVAAVLAASSTYFLGLFPILARAHGDGGREFHQLVERSLHLTLLASLPLVIVGSAFPGEVIASLFGAAYRDAGPALRLLAWSALLVVARGTLRQALCASGHQRADLWAAAGATAVNVGLNLLCIPRWGILGAAAATVASEVVWVVSVAAVAVRRLGPMRLRWAGPIGGAALIGALPAVLPVPLSWPWRMGLVLLLYAGALLAFRDPWAWAVMRRGKETPRP